MLFKQKAINGWVFLYFGLGFVLFFFFKFYTTETESYFLKCQAVVSHTAQHILKHFPVMKHGVQICICRTAGLVNVDFTAPYMGVKHYSLLAPAFQIFVDKQTLSLVMLLHLRVKNNRTLALGTALFVPNFNVKISLEDLK